MKSFQQYYTHAAKILGFFEERRVTKKTEELGASGRHKSLGGGTRDSDTVLKYFVPAAKCTEVLRVASFLQQTTLLQTLAFVQ